MSECTIEYMALLLASCVTTEDRNELLQRHGFKRHSAGSFKRCYVRKDTDYVVKLTFYGLGGAHEVENYQTAPDHIRRYLLPILASGDGWQIQNRLEKSGHENCPSTCPVRSLNDLQGANHIHTQDGTPIVFDYGQSGQWPKAA